jgi:type I restriction enzyme S subunit
VIGFGHIAEPDFYTHFPAMLPRSSRPRAAWGTGVYPSKQYFDIKMRCLRQRRHRRRWYLKGADNTPYEKIGDEVRSLADEVPFDIPDSWEWVRLGELFQHNTGKALNAANRTGQLKQYITTSNLYWDRFELNNLKEMHFSESEVEKCTVIKGDLLVCEGGDIGRAAIWPFDYPMCIQNHIHRLRAYVPICTRFFYYLFDLYKHAGWIGGKGIGIQGLSSNAIHSLLFPLPPLAEQYRIVDAIVTLQPYTDAYADVESTLDILNTAFPERLKKSILQEAVQGKLVPQDPSDEPAEALLERIRVEKQRLIKEGKIKKDKHESVIFRRDNSHYEKRGSEEVCIDDEIPFEIPENWVWCRLGSILEKLTDGAHSTPKYTDSGVPFISVKDVSSGVLSFDSAKHISESEHRELYKRCDPKRGDILLTKVGTTGIPVIVDTDEEFSLFVSVAQLRFLHSLLDKNYLLLLIQSPLVQQQCTEHTRGVGNKNWVMRDIANTLVAIPPLAEQKRIVAFYTSITPLIQSVGTV